MNPLAKNQKNILISALLLMGFAVAGALMVGVTHILTKADIHRNEQLTLLRKLNNIIPASQYDNDLLTDTVSIAADQLLGINKREIIYRARKQKRDVAVVLPIIAPDGYNGPIEMLVGIYKTGKIAGVRIIEQRETPGLGDQAQIKHSKWILGFNQKSLHQPDAKHWKVKRDGGVFDQFTGATITPRAIVKAVHHALIYFNKHQAELFRPQTHSQPAAEKKHV